MSNKILNISVSCQSWFKSPSSLWARCIWSRRHVICAYERRA